MQHHQFKRGVLRLVAAFGLQPEALAEQPPVIHIPTSRSSTLSRNTSGHASDDDVPSVAEQTAALIVWGRGEGGGKRRGGKKRAKEEGLATSKHNSVPAEPHQKN